MTEQADTAAFAPETGTPESHDAQGVVAWRKRARKALIAARQALSPDQRTAVRDALAARLAQDFPELRDHVLGFYWPIQGEPDLRGFVKDRIVEGASAALPVVVAKRQPVEFWHWRPEMRMVKGDWGIPQPPTREPVRPTALLVPLVGFDEAGYRLGYGAGYYDRTLAALDPKPLCIGVGLELGRLPSVHPQPHDIPMDAIVTERRTLRLSPSDS